MIIFQGIDKYIHGCKKRQTFSGFPEPGLPAGCRGKRVGLVVLYESGGRCNIDPACGLSNVFITLLFELIRDATK